MREHHSHTRTSINTRRKASRKTGANVQISLSNNGLSLTVYKWHSFGSYIYNFTWASYIFRFHLYTLSSSSSSSSSISLLFVFCRPLRLYSPPTTIIQPEATFTIQIIFLWIFFFILAPKSVSIRMVDDIMYRSWLVHMTNTLFVVFVVDAQRINRNEEEE